MKTLSRILSLLSTTVLIVGASVWEHPLTAEAVTVPAYTKSYYIGTGYGTSYGTGSAIYNAGYNAPNVSGIVILDFGAQAVQNSSWGALAPGTSNYFRDDVTISNMAQAFISGFNANPNHTASILLCVGTNNDDPLTADDYSNAGEAWWYVTNDVVSQGHCTVESASDIEGWTDATKTTNWVNGFNNTDSNATEMYDYGDQGYNYGSGWTMYDAYYYAYGAPNDFALPEIYTTSQASEWESVNQSYPMWFSGVTSENGSNGTLTASQSYTALYNATGGDVGSLLTVI